MRNDPKLIAELKKQLKFEVSCAISDELDNFVDQYDNFITDADAYHMSEYFDKSLADVIDELVDECFNK